LNKRALVTVLVGLALLLIAATIRSGWLYLVSSVLFALVIIGLLSGRLATRKLVVSREAPAEVFEGEPFDVRLRVANTGRTGRHLVSFKDTQFQGKGRGGFFSKVREQRKQFKEFLRTGKAPAVLPNVRDDRIKMVTIEDLPGGSQVNTEYEVRAPKRGVYGPVAITISSGGTFGSTETRRTSEAGGVTTVFPRIFPIESFQFDPRASLAPVEPIEWSRKGIGQDYYGTREYFRGDSLRHIHWRSSARQGKLIVKEYEQDLKPSVALAVALWAPARGDDVHNSLEDGLRAAASITSFHESMGGLPLLVLPRGDSFAPFEAPTLFRCLEALAAYEPPPRGNMAQALVAIVETALEAMLPGSALVLVTNAPGEQVAVALDSFARVAAGSVVLVLDESYGPGRKGEPLDEPPWLAGFAGLNLNVYAVVSSMEIGKCLNDPLSITGS
jgi:uncharacterized protein (DUF58 family)